MGIPTGVEGEIYEDITIAERNRATVFEDRKEGIETLLRIRDNNYRKKGVKAVLFGLQYGNDKPKYAVYVEEGFLTETGD